MSYRVFKTLQKQCEDEVSLRSPWKAGFSLTPQDRKRSNLKAAILTACFGLFVTLSTWLTDEAEQLPAERIGPGPIELSAWVVLAVLIFFGERAFQLGKLESAFKRQRVSEVNRLLAARIAQAHDGINASLIARLLLWSRILFTGFAGLSIITASLMFIIWMFLAANYLGAGLFLVGLGLGTITLVTSILMAIRHNHVQRMVWWALILGGLGGLALALVW